MLLPRRSRHGWNAAVISVVAMLLVPLAWRGAAAAPRPIGVIDLHVDLSYQINYRNQDLSRGSGQYLATELLSSGVAGVVLPLYVPKDVSPEGPRLADFEASYRKLTAAIAATKPYALPGAELPDSVRTWLAFEGSAPFAADASSIGAWIERGAKFFGLVHTYDNVLGTSAGTGRVVRVTHHGLSEAGKALVTRVLAQGGIIDVSHASDATTDDVLRLSKVAGAPVVATHSNARRLAAHTRNLGDAQIREIAASGGVIGVNFNSTFLTSAARRATLADVVRQIEYLKRLGGIDHVAIGSDFEGGITPPRALADVRGFPALSAALASAGFTHEEIRKVFGLNALRLLSRGRNGRAEAEPLSE